MLEADVDRAGAAGRCSGASTLSPRYSVVVANPPYMGTGNMSGDSAELG